MKKLFLNKGFFLAFVLIFLFLAVRAEAAPLTEVDMLSAGNHLYVSDKASGDIYIFDIAKKGEFIKKISLGANTQPSHMLYVYNRYVLVALSNASKIAVINNTSLSIANYIQTPINPYYLAVDRNITTSSISQKLVMTASRNNAASYAPPATIDISFTDSGVNITPGTAHYIWNTSDLYFTGEERVFTFINNQSYPNFMIFHDQVEVASETYELNSSSQPIKMHSDPNWTNLSMEYADFSVDHDFYMGYYVGKEGYSGNKIQQMYLSENKVVSEKTLPDSSYVPVAVSAVSQTSGDTLYVGVKSDAATGANLGVFSYDIVHSGDPNSGSAINIKHRFTIPAGEQVLERGVEGTWHSEPEAFAVTANALYHLDGNAVLPVVKKYDFNTQSPAGGENNSTKPDLVVSDISYQASKYLVNEYGKLSVTVTNNGGDLMVSDGLKGYQDDADFASFSTNVSQVEVSRALPTANNPLKTGDSIKFTWQGKFLSAGDNPVQYYIDSKNNLDESNETNNLLTKTIIIKEEGATGDKMPDMVVSDLKMEDNPSGGKSLYFYVKNIGDAIIPVGEVELKITINNDVRDSYAFPVNSEDNVLNKNIYINERIDIEEPGDYVVTFEIDPNNIVSEKKEDNNVYTKRFSIGSTDDSQKATTDRARIQEMLQAASDLINENYDRILFEIKEVRDEIKENKVKLKYLNQLISKTKNLNKKIESALNKFIAYGVDDNTKRLGEGERAAVIHSYYAAYNKLPETEEDLADAIKAANGRWPSQTNSEAEMRAKEHFRKVYKKIPDMTNPNDNAAVVVIAYGLRQSAENRNLESERAGIQTFINIYGYHPNTTIDWNIMQAITYSGATRGIDSDGDYLLDDREVEFGTDPNNPDSDGDGFLDGIEILYGYCPLSEESMELGNPNCSAQ